MDKKKLLIMVICIGFFLVIIIGGSILLFSPRTVSVVPPPDQQPTSTSTSDPVTTPVLSATHEEEPVTASLDPKPPFTGYTEDSVNPLPEQQERTTVVSVPRPSTAGVPHTTATESSSQRVTKPATSTPVTPAVKASPSPASAAKPTQTPKSVAAPQAKIIASYWIQTGSFSTLTRAESAKELLMTKGFSSIIESSDVRGEMFYRVRVGPYTSKNEAEYWLPIVKAIEGFEESLVWQTQSRQS
ncbi:MAG: SPOR domain-containing protein [Spirochaetaceae bacterium]|jgi:DedD protein|nr:SPOR domain-containing protein [Spirochaetaceae bacterium]